MANVIQRLTPGFLLATLCTLSACGGQSFDSGNTRDGGKDGSSSFQEGGAQPNGPDTVLIRRLEKTNWTIPKINWVREVRYTYTGECLTGMTFHDMNENPPLLYEKREIRVGSSCMPTQATRTYYPKGKATYHSSITYKYDGSGRFTGYESQQTGKLLQRKKIEYDLQGRISKTEFFATGWHTVFSTYSYTGNRINKVIARSQQSGQPKVTSKTHFDLQNGQLTRRQNVDTDGDTKTTTYSYGSDGYLKNDQFSCSWCSSPDKVEYKSSYTHDPNKLLSTYIHYGRKTSPGAGFDIEDRYIHTYSNKKWRLPLAYFRALRPCFSGDQKAAQTMSLIHIVDDMEEITDDW